MITKPPLISRATLCVASIAAAASWNGLAAGHDAVSAYPTKPLLIASEIVATARKQFAATISGEIAQWKKLVACERIK